MSSGMQLAAGTRTDVGRVRKANQDSLAVVDSAALGGLADGLYVVADGMGGRAGGEIASSLAVQAVSEAVRDRLAETAPAADGSDLVEALAAAMRAANEAVWGQTRARPELRGMGTTCVAVLVRARVAAVGNVGDSRAYLLREGAITQITHDHSLVQEHVRAGDLSPEEARSSRFRNVVTRAIGVASLVEPDVACLRLADGDCLLLCSDGLTNMLRDGEIARILASEPDPQTAADRLVDAANERGGIDNITSVVVHAGVFVPLDLPGGTNGEVTLPREPLGAAAAASRPRRGYGLFAVAAPWTLAAALAVVLWMVGSGAFRLTPQWPFLAPVPPPAPRAPAAAPIDYARLHYGAPALVTTKPVRGWPLACDPQGAVYAMTLAGKVIRLEPDGQVRGDFGPPVHLAIAPPERSWAADPAGNLYVSVRRERAIYKHAPSGTRIAVIGEGRLQDPQGVAVDARGRVYVVDGTRLLRFPAEPPPGERANGSR